MTAVGIDFGNSFLSVAVHPSGKPAEVVADADGNWKLPAVVNYSSDLKPRIGEEASKQLPRDPKGTIYDFKRLIGQPFSEIQSLKSNWGFPLVPGKKGQPSITVRSEGKDLQLLPSEILCELFKKLKESSIHSKTKRVAIAVPYEMQAEPRNAIIESAKGAGFTHVHLIPDPIAAVLAYNLDAEDNTGTTKQVIVIDFGTYLTLSLLFISNGIISVKKHLVCKDISAASVDTQLVNHFKADFKRKTGLDISESKRSIIRLQQEVIRVKTVLSQVPEAKVQMEGLYEGMDLNSSVTRARFEGMNGSLFNKISTQVSEFIEGQIAPTHVILSGGNCKIPRIQTMLQGIFTDIKISTSINPNDVGAVGAAIQANIFDERAQNTKEVTVAPTLPLSIGIGTADGTFVPMLQKGTVTPTKVMKQFGNSTETQTEFFLSVYEGEDGLVANNTLLGHFSLSGLPAKPVGETVVNVEFLVGTNGVLSVQASSGNQVATLKFEGTAERKTVPEGDL